MSAGPGATQRLDRWLWHARVVKTRTIATNLVAEGYVRVNGERAQQPARAVKHGDVITVALPTRVRVLKVIGLLSHRADAAAARHAYESMTAKN